MSEDVKQLYEELRETWSEMQHVMEDQDREIKSFGTFSGETQATLDKLNARLDEIETKMARPPVTPVIEPQKFDADLAKKAYESFLRKGVDYMPVEERKFLATDDDTQGGYLVPVNTRNRILEYLVVENPIRQYVSQETITIGNTLEIPKEGGSWGAGWIGERVAPTETATGTFAGESVPTHEMYAEPQATQTMLDDTAFDVEGWITRKVSTKMGQLESLAFISGSGVGQPEGLLTHPGVTHLPSLHADNIETGDCLLDLIYDLPDAYARNGRFLMRRATVGVLRKIRTITDGQYVWQPGLTMEAPNMILGHPYTECPDMPAIGAGTFPIIFGDLRAAYLIVDRQGIRVVRDIYTAKPFVKFYTTRRVGGQVIMAEALRKLEVAAS